MGVSSQRIGRIWKFKDWGMNILNIPGVKNIMSKGLGTGKQGKICRVGTDICLVGALQDFVVISEIPCSLSSAQHLYHSYWSHPYCQGCCWNKISKWNALFHQRNEAVNQADLLKFNSGNWGAGHILVTIKSTFNEAQWLEKFAKIQINVCESIIPFIETITKLS